METCDGGRLAEILKLGPGEGRSAQASGFIIPDGASPYLTKADSYNSLTKKNHISKLRHKSERRKLKVQIVDGMFEEKSGSSGGRGTERVYGSPQPTGKIQQKYDFYKTQSNLSQRSELGALKNKLTDPTSMSVEQLTSQGNFRRNSRASKLRFAKYKAQKSMDREL